MKPFKEKLRAREIVSLINANHPCPGLVDSVCRLGIDAVMLDCEQGNPSYEDVETLSRIAALNNVSSIVRIPSPEPWIIERYMMRGVDGLVIPRLNTAQEVSAALEAVRYAVPSTFSQKTIIVQVETVGAVAELEQFLTIPEVDCFFVGAVDLSKSMGFEGDYSGLEVREVLKEVVAKIIAQQRSVGFLVKEHDLHFWKSRGVNMLYSHVNEFLAIGARHWREMAEMHPLTRPITSRHL